MASTAAAERSGDVDSWIESVHALGLFGRMPLVEIDVSRDFYWRLAEKLETVGNGRTLTIWGAKIVIREDLPFAEEIAA